MSRPQNKNLKRTRGPGRPKGSKDSIPRGFRASVKAFYEELAENDPELIRRALVRGLKAPPRDAFRFVQMMAHYCDGRPIERIEIERDGPKQVELETLREIHRSVEESQQKRREKLRAKLTDSDTTTISRDELETLARRVTDISKLTHEELVALALQAVEREER